jgi:hypothetical protein
MELELAGNSHISSLGDAPSGRHDETDDAVVVLLLDIGEKRFSCCFGGCGNMFVKSDSSLVTRCLD